MTQGDRVFVTCYSGYGMDVKEPGKMEDLGRHLLCLERGTGKPKWAKEFEPALPEHKYQGEGAYHGYAASTPVIDGEFLYVFFGKSGVYCFDLDGKEVWHASVGTKTIGWGSGTSPILYVRRRRSGAAPPCPPRHPPLAFSGVGGERFGP